MQQLIRFYLLLALWIGLAGVGKAQSADKTTKIAILLFPGVELLDFAGPLEVFNHMEGADVYTVATQTGPMKIMQNRLTVTPDYSPDNAPQPDILVVPGGRMDEVAENKAVVDWIQRTAASRQLTMSVCTGTFLLGKAGLLDGKTVTTHWTATDMLQQMTPKATVMEHTRFVDAGSVVTTAGVSAGIDGALHVVLRLKGHSAAQEIARIMEYDKWDPAAGLVIGKRPAQTARKATTPTNPTKPTVVKKKAPPLPSASLSSTIDLVCQMSVAGYLADTARYMGKTYGFCSKICKARFKQTPTAYVKTK